MIIDFHTHIFPDNIAEKTIMKLSSLIHEKPYTNGTLQELKTSMKKAGVDYSVVLPVVTRPEQFRTVNQFAADITGKDGILSFGGLHPKSERIKEELDDIAGLGLKGIKLHPDFQGMFIDDKRYIELITYALQKGLMVVIHAGVDEGLPDPVHCPPDKAAYMIEQVGRYVSTEKIVLAHTGGLHMYNEVEKFLVGKDVYFDISFSRIDISKEQITRIIQNHGADKILFGSDSPWDGQKECVEYVNTLSITETEKQKILGGNAKELLF